MTHAFDSLRPALSYLSPEEVGVIEEAYEFSRRAHEGQFRKSGEPYISHPLAVAGILAGWHLDAQTLTAALLHDVVEDTPATASEIEARFGKAVALLVEGVSKLDKLAFASEQHAQAENFRKMLLAMAQDVRVILVKLADRQHNMHTMDSMPAEKRRRIAAETLEIYAPIANRLGLHSVYQELEDLGFRYSHPNRYQVLAKAVKAARGNRRELVDKVKIALQEKLAQAGIDATISGREKHLYSIYRKMQEKNLAFSEVFDIYGFRVVVRDQPSCYLALGALHGAYKPIPGKFKDYIAIPKANGYQSLHSILFGPNGTPIEVQIRTTDMSRLAESGVASHWMYKSADAALNDVQTRTHRWLQSLLDIQADHGDSTEFLEHIKIDLFPDEVYVFTPKGKIMALPRGATAVDFGFAVHTDVGRHCIAVKINYELMPLRTQLRNGDHVEILTASNATPNAAWLNFVVTGKARSHIRNYLRTARVKEAAALGEQLLNNAIAALHPESAEPEPAVWERLLKDYAMQSRQELFTAIGLGAKLPLVVAHQLLHVQGAPARPHHPRDRRHSGRAGAVLSSHSGRPDSRLHPQGPRPHHPYPRLPVDPGIPHRSGQMAGRRVGGRARPHVRRLDQGRRRQQARRAGKSRRRHCRTRLQHRQRFHGGRGRQPLHRAVFHRAGGEPHASRSRDAWPAQPARRRADLPHQGEKGRPRRAIAMILPTH
jgi:guanosine-3',5'-bis(diphosphate) 3'-pyrophosphohydrolase